MIVLETLLYILVFILVWLLAYYVLVKPATIVFLRHPDWWPGPFSRTYHNIFVGYACLAMIFAFPLSYHVLSFLFHYRPPFLTQRELVFDSEEPNRKIKELKAESQRLSSALSEIEDLTIREVRDTLSQAITFVGKLQDQAIAQERLVTSLRREVEKQRKSADEAKTLAETVTSLTDPQIEAIKQLITEDARAQSNRGFWIGVITAFPIAVIASLFTRWLLGITTRRTKQEVQKGLRETA